MADRGFIMMLTLGGGRQEMGGTGGSHTMLLCWVVDLKVLIFNTKE